MSCYLNCFLAAVSRHQLENKRYVLDEAVLFLLERGSESEKAELLDSDDKEYMSELGREN